MGYINIEDFKSGLDTRRMEVTSTAGSLQTLKNAHITRGGEIEKAKDLVTKYDVSSTFGLASLLDQLFVFGHTTRPSGLDVAVGYQQLAHPDGLAMTRVVFTDIAANRLYVVAEYADGSRMHFYNGVIVPDWFYGVVRAAFVDNDGTAEHLKTIVDADPDFSASRTGSVITITGQPGVSFPITATALNGEGNAATDQTAVVATTQAAVPGVAEVRAVGSFNITGGTASPGVNKLNSVTVNGVEVLGVAVNWSTSNVVTAEAVAAQISVFASPDYSATAAAGKVTITAAAGTGSTPNGYVVATTPAGTLTTGSVVNMAGGVTAIPGPAQISTVTIGGTFEVGDLFAITIGEDPNEEVFGATRTAGKLANSLKLHKNKMYAGYGPNIAFSGVAEFAEWDDQAIGSGVIDLSSQASGFQDITGIGIYQNNLAFFSRRCTQIWSVDPDPDLNSQIQVLPNTGTDSPDSILSLGDTDLLYLSDTGYRSIRARDAINIASVTDIGTPIDTLVIADMKGLTRETIQRAQGIVEPIDGRAMQALGPKIYVFSYFNSSRISAWSTYEMGISVEKFVTANNRLYVRANDTIYLSGGDNDDQYSSTPPVVILPYIDGKKQATFKNWKSLDIACEGSWKIEANWDPNQPETYEDLATVTETTYCKQKIAITPRSPLLKLRITNTTEGYARIGSITVHYDELPQT